MPSVAGGAYSGNLGKNTGAVDQDLSAAPLLSYRELRMRPHTGMARILITLLVLRVLAAPIAARPDITWPTSHGRFIVRVCSWPAQRPMRVTTPAVLVRRSRCPADGLTSFRLPPSQLRGPDPFSARAALARFALGSSRNKSPVHLSDCPRC